MFPPEARRTLRPAVSGKGDHMPGLPS